MANPFTTMRENVEYALVNSPDLLALEVTVRVWSGARRQLVDNPKGDLGLWARLDLDAIEDNPYWGNAMHRTTQRLILAAALPTQAGKKLEDMEQLAWGIIRAMHGIARGTMQTPVPSVEKFTFHGGEMGLLESTLPNKQDVTDAIRWVYAGSVEIVHDFADTVITAP